MKKRMVNIQRSEDGAIMVIAAILIVVLLAFAALAVDLGALFVERRQAQTAADVAALSGAQTGRGLAGTDARKAINDEVQRITFTNLGTTGPEWGACTDTAAPAEFTQTAPAGGSSAATPCVSFTATLDKIRVRIPTLSVPTTFARVMGISTMDTSAFAEVEFATEQSGDILPFGVPAGDAGNTLGCPSDHPNGVLPCNGPEAGNFNQLFITQWGDTDLGTTQTCNKSDGVFEQNLAVGVDHLLGTVAMNLLRDEDVCDDPNVDARPSIIGQDTGVSQSTLEPGLISGTKSGQIGRLTNTTFTTVTLSSGGTAYEVDNKPLWEFIGSGLSDVPSTCGADTFGKNYDPTFLFPISNTAQYIPSGPPGSKLFDWDRQWWIEQGLVEPNPIYEPNNSFEHMWRCLRDYKTGGYGGVLFNVDSDGKTDAFFDLQRSPRWGWAPVGPFVVGSGDFKIQDFKPIFIQTLVRECDATSCGWQWQAGEALPSNVLKPAKIQSLVSFQIPETALPNSVVEAGPSSSTVGLYRLSR